MTDPDKSRFVEAYGRLAVALRDKDPDVVAFQVFFDNLRDLEIELVVAAGARLERADWFPKVGDWRREVQRVECERTKAQREMLRRLPRALCDNCSDTGWVEIGPGETDKRNSAPRRAQPCACAQQRRLELLGRSPWPTLPAGAQPRDDRPLSRVESTALVTRYARERGVPRLVKSMPKVAPVVDDLHEADVEV